MSIAGIWETTTQTPFGEQSAELTLIDDGAGNLSGTNVTPMGTMTIKDGRAEGVEATFSLKMKSPMPMTFQASVTVDGDVMTGEVKAGPFGSSPLQGRRIG